MSSLALWSAALAALERGERAALALVADHTRHSPGTRGAKLVVTPEHTLGTIGGGVMELRTLEELELMRAADSPVARVTTLYHRKEAPGASSGLFCAGWQTNVRAVLEPERDRDGLREVVARLLQDAPGVLTLCPSAGLSVHDVAPDPSRAPSRVVVDEDGWRYEEELLDYKRVAVFGAGHCGLALSRQLDWLGYVVTIADTREDTPTLAQNTFARHRVVGPDYTTLAARVSHPNLTSAVVMTTDVHSDIDALEGALRAPFASVGVMGAPAKLRAIRAALSERGFSDDELDRLRGPVGLKIGSSTPPEIAVSVAAELVSMHSELFPGARPTPFDADPVVEDA